MRFRNLKLGIKFSLGIGVILLLFCIIFSLLLYINLRDRAIIEAKEKTLIILTQIGAVGDYIKNDLRPKMFKIIPPDSNSEFIVEAMSSTHVTHEVMKRFNTEFRDYVYKRVSDNPLNPKNRADPLHTDLINYFRKNRGQQTWDTITKINGEDVIIRARAVISTKGCLVCHGDPARAPKGLVRQYGRSIGFGWKEGDVIGVESVEIPLAVTFRKIKDIAISTFILGATTLLLLFLSLQGIFWSLVSRPLNRLTTIFRGIVKGTEPLSQSLPITANDEIGELTASFNLMAEHLYEAQRKLQKNAETLRSIFESISDPLALVNPDCSVETTNSAYQEWASRGINAVFTKECHTDNCDADTLCPICFLKKVKEEKRALAEYWEDNGRYYYVHFYPVFDETGAVIKVVHYVKDVTERRHMDEQMRITEKLAAVGQLSAGIAHEINNPLGGIRLCFNNLMVTSMDSNTKKLHIEVINSGLEKIQDIIQHLMDFSKKTAISMSPEAINQLIENVLKLTDYLITKKKDHGYQGPSCQHSGHHGGQKQNGAGIFEYHPERYTGN